MDSPADPAELAAFLRTNPAAAFVAVKASKIAGPRIRNGIQSYRQALCGKRVGWAINEGSGWFSSGPEEIVPKRRGESEADFIARVDAALLGLGWVLL